MMDTEHLRLVNLVVSLLLAGTLSWRGAYHHGESNIDDRLRAGALMLFFAVAAVASGTYFQENYPTSGVLYAVTTTLTLYLVALWTPWRWHLPRRNP